jgi:hypothetical protein
MAMIDAGTFQRYAAEPAAFRADLIVDVDGTCPSCGAVVEFDFQAVAGLVWCLVCQKMFSPPVSANEPTAIGAERGTEEIGENT